MEHDNLTPTTRVINDVDALGLNRTRRTTLTPEDPSLPRSTRRRQSLRRPNLTGPAGDDEVPRGALPAGDRRTPPGAAAPRGAGLSLTASTAGSRPIYFPPGGAAAPCLCRRCRASSRAINGSGQLVEGGEGRGGLWAFAPLGIRSPPAVGSGELAAPPASGGGGGGEDGSRG